MITQPDRVRIRSTHQAADGQCVVRGEAWPCDAIRLLDELEIVEAQARLQHEQLALAKQRNEELRQKILRAIQELT